MAHGVNVLGPPVVPRGCGQPGEPTRPSIRSKTALTVVNLTRCSVVRSCYDGNICQWLNRCVIVLS